MELTANRRPFIYFPLKHHFEQNFHVHHRLERYGAGRRMDFDDSPPDAIAEAIAEEIGREVDYRPVETDGARRAAERLAEMLSAWRHESTVSPASSPDPAAARYPDSEGFVERDGVRIFYELYGEGEPTILFLPRLVDRPLADLEGPDPLLRAPLSGPRLRRARQRPLRPPRRPRGLR